MQLKVKLVFNKATKGTFVYDMQTEQGQSMGSLYIPKLVMPADPPKLLEMEVRDAAGN